MKRTPRYIVMRMMFPILVVAAMAGSGGIALAQVQTTPGPQQPPVSDIGAAQIPAQAREPQQPTVNSFQRTTAPGYVAPAPFGGLYNVLSGTQPPAAGKPQPLTPYNTP